jgi:hypothetical protein
MLSFADATSEQANRGPDMSREDQKFSTPHRRQRREPPETTVADQIPPDSMLDLIQRGAGTGQIDTAVVEDISPDGVPMVVLRGEEQRREALSLLRFPSADAASDSILGRTVLVLANGSGMPVILGVVSQRLWETREVEAQLPAGEARAVQVDKKLVNLEATEEIRLTCGKSSLVMRRDGTVVVRGVTITTRATQSNKIRGATVSIN